MVAAIQLLSNAGIQGETAGTTLRGALLALTSPSKEAGALLQQMGVQVADAAGNVRPLASILEDLQSATDGLGSAQTLNILGTLFGARPAGGIAELLSQGSDRLRDLTGELRNAAGTADRIATQQLDNLPGDITVLKSSIEGLGIAIGDSFDDPLRGVIQRASEITSIAASWAKENQGLVASLALVAGGATALGLTMVGVGIAAAGASVAVGGFAAVGALVLTPLGLVVTGAAAAATALVGLGAVVVTQSEAARQVLGVVQRELSGVTDCIFTSIGRIGNALSAGDLGTAAEIAGLSIAQGLAQGVSMGIDLTAKGLKTITTGLLSFADRIQSILAELI